MSFTAIKKERESNMIEKKEAESTSLKIRPEDANILYAMGLEQVLIGLRTLKILGENTPDFPQVEYNIFSVLFEEFSLRQQKLNIMFAKAVEQQNRPAYDEHMGYL
jgi:hypothetical protein